MTLLTCEDGLIEGIASDTLPGMARHPDKVRENRVRLMAGRQALELTKSRRRDPLALDYGGYMLTDATVDDPPYIVFGSRSVNDDVRYFTATLDEVETWLLSGAWTRRAREAAPA